MDMLIHLNDWYPVWLSLRVAVMSAIIVTITSLPLARLVEKKRFWGRDLLEAAITLPLVLPPSVVGYVLLVLIGVNGPLGKLFG